MRHLATGLSENNTLSSEMALFSFSLSSGGEEVRQAPIVYIPDLSRKIFQLLDKNERYTHAITYNNFNITH